MAAWLFWVKWLQGGTWRWHALAMIAFVLALFSKESAFVLPLLMLIPVLADRPRWRRALVGIAPFVAMTTVYVAWIWISRVAQPGYGDIRFSLSSPWPLVIAKSYWRMMFVWGLVAAAILWWMGGDSGRRPLLGTKRMIWISSLWMALGILPYSFLTYMNQIPSRATYLGSVGLALLVGAAAAVLLQQRRRPLLFLLTAIVLTANLEILWVKKMSQFRERAEPSELLKQAVAQASGPISIECTPLLPIVAEVVVEQAGGKIAAEQKRREEHCFSIQYESRTGERISVNRPMGTKKHGLFY
jgi:hypothetical protein